MSLTNEQRRPFVIPGPGDVDLHAQWIVRPDTDEVIGLLAHHPHEQMSAGRWPECGGGGYIAWQQVPGYTPAARHQLVSGGPGDLAALTITPSLWHRAKASSTANSPHHGCHGFVRDGRWEPV